MKIIPLPFYCIKPEYAAAVPAPPYDTLSANAAKQLQMQQPDTFLQVSRPDFYTSPPITTAPHDLSAWLSIAYANGKKVLNRLIEQGRYAQESQPCFYAYQLNDGQTVYLGVVLGASIADYIKNKILRIEYTRSDREIDRLRHLEAVGAHTAAVTLLYRDSAATAALLEEVTQATPPLVATQDNNNVTHSLWPIRDLTICEQLIQKFAQIEALYIVDGHHRVAAASRLTTSRRAMGQVAQGDRGEFFMAMCFPSSAIQLLPYHRLVGDLGHLTPTTFLKALAEKFVITPSNTMLTKPECLTMCFEQKIYTLQLRQLERSNDPVRHLAVSVLHTHIIEPILDIVDPWHDLRLQVIAGNNDDQDHQLRDHLQQNNVGFCLHAPQTAEILQVADKGAIIPPKSIWVKPQLRDGLLFTPLS